MAKIVNVYITGGEQSGWALDMEIKQLISALQNIPSVIIANSPEDADIIYSVWWESLMRIPVSLLSRKYVICSMCNRPFHEFTQPHFSVFLPLIDLVVAQSTEAMQELQSVGVTCVYAPYTLDTSIFSPLEQKHLLRAKYHLPQDAYILGNFHRDSEGANLTLSKLQKGADIFFEMIQLVWRSYKNIHVLLAGPRRHWLRTQLERAHIPYTFIGQITSDDDWKINILTLPQINELYQCLDLAIVSSRWEGAPRTLLEAAATRTKVISTNVGIAADLLVKKCLYANFIDGAELIRKDIETNILAETIEQHYATFTANHTTSALARHLEPIFTDHVFPALQNGKLNTPYQIIGHDFSTVKQPLQIGVWHEFFKPPYGGGNQFMMALSKALSKRGHHILANILSKRVDVYVLNSVHFDIKKFQAVRKKQALKIVHRIDGPIQIYRGNSKELDDLCHQLNCEFADFTIVQSIYTFIRSFQLGYRFVRPVLIRNAVDPEIFNREGKIPFAMNRKIRLISTSWSDNVRKGGAVYQWLDQHLDFDRYEYTFVGRLPDLHQEMKHIRVLPPVPSEELAEILKQHDIYLFASQHESCSNALIEALVCGLPTVYLKSGSNSEIVGSGGLGFDKQEDIPKLLETMVEHYESFQRLIVVEPLDKVADKYEEVLRLASQRRPACRQWSLRKIWEKCRTMFLKRS